MKVIIVGGVAGGASCAARLRRLSEDAEIVLFERGENISYANCGRPYYLGGIIREESALTVASPALLRDRFRIDVRIRSEVIAIDRENHTVTVRTPEGEYQESYEKLVLTPGASPKTFGLGGEGVFTLRDVHDTLSIDAYLKGTGTREVLVAGGGFIGVEMAENLAHRGLKVTRAECAPQIMPPFDPELALLLQDALEKVVHHKEQRPGKVDAQGRHALLDELRVTVEEVDEKVGKEKQKGVPAMRIYFAGIFMMSLQFAGQSTAVALGRSKQAVFFSLFRKVIIVIPLTLLLPAVGGLGTDGVFLAEPISNFVGGTACFVTMLLTVWPMLSRKEKEAKNTL